MHRDVPKHSMHPTSLNPQKPLVDGSHLKLRVYAVSLMHLLPVLCSHLSLNSCENIFCQISIHFCCWAVSAFPGFLNVRVKISRKRARRVLMASIAFQSDTAKRARFPSRMNTPAYIWIRSAVALSRVQRYLHRNAHLHIAMRLKIPRLQWFHERCKILKCQFLLHDREPLLTVLLA